MTTATLSAGTAQASPNFSSHKLTFLGAVRGEAIKFRTLATNWIMLAVTLLIMVGMGAMFAVATNQMHESALAAQEAVVVGAAPVAGPTVDDVYNYARGIGDSGMMFGSMLVASIAVVFIGSEYASRQINTTLTAVPRRTTAFVSKLLVVSLWTFFIGFISAALSYGIAQLILDSAITEAVAINGDVVRNWVAVGIYCMLMSWMGLGFGTLLRNNAGGIVLVVVLMFILTIALNMVAGASELIQDFVPYLPMALGQSFTAVGVADDAAITNLEAGLWLSVWCLVPALLGWARLALTDSK
ncbi:hypothetical protein [Rothia endophytica]|uniref:hypothetical protein n=1 Tax=Rothia endophytica TaxID=1324766 RepID=UPI001F31C8D9|nr:hypothetical protein [Rothia endophytica]